MKTALITGSTRGIGEQIGIDLIEKDYFVYFNGHNYTSIDQLNIDLMDYCDYKVIYADLSYLDGVQTIVDNVKTLDVLVLNAGITDRTPFGKISVDNWNHVINVNLTNQFFLIQALKNKLNRNGKIVFVSSIAGIVPDSVSISYGVSKAAINMLVPYLAKEFAEKNITVNAIAPGYTNTDWHKNKSKAQIKRITDKCLAKRLGITQEISKAVLSIINNDFINGQVIRIDGGFGL